jgi:hypothetical protein
MVGLSGLWLPILLSAVLVFVGSSIIHMVLPWHKSDYRAIPNEDKVMEALRPFAIPPGDYMVPRPASMAAMKSAEFIEKRNKGPVMVVTVMPSGAMSMGGPMVLWFLYSLVISFLAAYVSGRALPSGAPYLHVFRFAGVSAFMGYSMGLFQMSIWYRRSWKTSITSAFDGLIYGLLTAGAFGWLWPR